VTKQPETCQALRHLRHPRRCSLFLSLSRLSPLFHRHQEKEGKQGREARMKTAVEELLKSPQNNLKIFKDGFVVYDQTSSPDDLESVLDEWFRNAVSTSNGARTRRTDEFCNLVCAALTRPFAQEQLELLAVVHPRNFLLPTNQIPTFCAEPGMVARAERCLRFAEKVQSVFKNVLFFKK